jgi:cysteine desulfurase
MPARAAIYLDANAGAPLKPEALAAVRQLTSDLLPNPSSVHAHGRRAKRFLAEARERIALSLGSRTDPEQLVLASSGTEANQLAIRSALSPRIRAGQAPHWITTAVEHDSVRQMTDWLTARGGSVDVLGVDPDGRLDLDALASLIRPETALISAMWVNNETGVITDVARLAEIVRTARASNPELKLHIDAAQAWGKLPIDLETLGANYVAFSGHKIGGLAGTGVLHLARRTQAHAAIPGKQEKGRRGGTENLLGLASLGAAAATLEPVAWSARVAPLRDRLESEILARIPGARINGAGAPRVANTLNATFEGVEGDSLVMALDLAGYSVSSGSACASGVLEPSHVLLAMGRKAGEAMAAIRVSLYDECPWDELAGFVEALVDVVARIRRSAAAASSDRSDSAVGVSRGG